MEATTKEIKLNQKENKIVSIRKNKLDLSQINNIEDSIELAKQIRLDLCEDITELCMEQLMALLSTYGIFSDPIRYNAKDSIMIENAIASALYRYYGLEHPLQEVTDDVFKIDDDEGDGG